MATLSIKNIIKKMSARRGKDKLKTPIRPYRDWGILLAIFLVLLVAIAAAHTYLFIEISKEEIFFKERPVEEEIEMLDLEALESTIGFFGVRAEEFEEIRTNKPSIVDPSL